MDDTLKTKNKLEYSPPTIERYAPFFSAIPAKIPAFAGAVAKADGDRGYADLIRQPWEDTIGLIEDQDVQ